MAKSLLSGNKLRLVLHVVVWLLLFILPTYFLFGDSPRDLAFIIELWIQLFFYAILFYLSYLWLIPTLFFKGRKTACFVSIALVILLFTGGLYTANNLLEPMRHKNMRGFREMAPSGLQPREGIRPQGQPRRPSPIRNWPVINFIMTSCLLAGFSLGLRFYDRLVLNEELRQAAEKEKAAAELALLKHQINPHFLFNTLNSIYSLALIGSEMTAEAVMKLSDMMRYVIDDVGREKVPLSLELEYIRHYVELQKIRVSRNVEVVMETAGDPDGMEIPPLILFPFVENAFKFGTSSHEQAVIRIEASIAGDTILFQVYNRIFQGREQARSSGIGIGNTRLRLSHYYPGRHHLVVSTEGDNFTVRLSLTLV